MKKKFLLKFQLAILSTVCISFFSFAQQSYAQTKQDQLQCRAKSKQIAKTAFDQCIEVAKGDEAENIRKEFKLKFEKMKAFYVAKLKKVTSKMKKEAKSNTPASLPPKVQTDVSSASASMASTFSDPNPVNTQSGPNNEPQIRLKSADQNTPLPPAANTISTDEAPPSPNPSGPSIPEPEPSTLQPSSDFQPNSERLETEPSPAI